MLLVAGPRGEHRVGDLGYELRLAASDDRAGPAFGLELLRVSRSDHPRGLDLLLVHVGDRQALDRAGADDVERASRRAGDGERRHLPQRRLDVERRGEDAARLDEERGRSSLACSASSARFRSVISLTTAPIPTTASRREPGSSC